MKKIVLLLITAILIAGCTTKPERSRRFWGRTIDHTISSGAAYAGLGGSSWGNYTFMVISLPYPNTPSSESHYLNMYDNIHLWGKFEYVGTYAYSNGRYGANGTVPVYMPRDNFYYIYNKDKKYLIKVLNAMKIQHTFIAT